MKTVKEKRPKRSFGQWIAAFLLACICLSGIHPMFAPYRLGEWLFLAGLPGGIWMLLFTGVHGDFNAVGGIVYVVVNTICFYYLIQMARYLWNRVIRRV